jgi:hypothetical protein
MTPDQVVRPRTLSEPFENEFDGDARPAKDGLAEHDAGHPLDVALPVHGGIVSHGTPTRTTAERYLAAGEYFVLGTDLHNPQTLDVRLRGRHRLTKENPRTILGEGA